jgi:hypothetical protein
LAYQLETAITKIRDQSAIRNPQVRNFMRILFAGIIARYPFGGVTWCS